MLTEIYRRFYNNRLYNVEFSFVKVCIHFFGGPCIIGLSSNPICRKCGTEKVTSDDILCECEVLASLRYTYLGSFFLDPEDIGKLVLGPSCDYAKGTGLLKLSTEYMAQRACIKA